MDLKVLVVILGIGAYLYGSLYFLIDQIGWVVFASRSVEIPGRIVRIYDEHIGTGEYGRQHIVTRAEVEFETSDGSARRVTGRRKPGQCTVRYDPRTDVSVLAHDLRSMLITGWIIVASFVLPGAGVAVLFAWRTLA